MRIDNHSRVLLFAPHPDDEAIGTGGILQKAAAAGASVQIVFATNGDDNPWPHRLVERRWRIEVGDRMLWGMRRAEEARDALTTLGIPSGCVELLHLPDQRITDLLLEARTDVVSRLAAIIEQAEPTLIVAPSPFDVHPDHSALHLFVQLALAAAGRSDLEQLCYAVHTRGYHSDWSCVPIALTPEEQEVKRRAILCHYTQMVLSRSRFLRHAAPIEKYWRPAPPREIDAHHPVRSGGIVDGALVLQLQRRKRSRSFAQCTLLIALENGSAERWSVRLRRSSGAVVIEDAVTGEDIGAAEVEVHGVHAQVRLPLEPTAQPLRIFAKLEQPAIFFDVAGWREIPSAVSRLEPAARLRLNAPRFEKLRRGHRTRLKARVAR